MTPVEKANIESLITEQELNRMLRPGLSPLISYVRSPRLTSHLISKYKIEIFWTEIDVVTRITHRGISNQTTESFGSDDEAIKALGLAVARTVMTHLHILEKDCGKT